MQHRSQSDPLPLPDDQPSDLRLWYMIVAGVGLLLVVLIGGSLFVGSSTTPPADTSAGSANDDEPDLDRPEEPEKPAPRAHRNRRGGMAFLATVADIEGSGSVVDDDPRTWRFVAEVESEGESAIERWEWDFGDDTTAAGREATHTFEEGGYYRVRVTAFDREGRRSADYFRIWVRPPFLDSGDVADLEPGLRCEVYDLDELGREDVTGRLGDLEPTAVETVSRMVAGGHGQEDDFALAFVGYLVIDEPGTYRFTVAADDFVHLRVGPMDPIRSKYSNGFKEKSGTVDLEKGLLPFRLEFEEEQGGEEIIFRMERLDGDDAEPVVPTFLHRGE